MTATPHHLSPGRLLVATPELEDPNFQQSVVLLLAHGDDGSLGVVVNRPGELPVTDVLPALARAVSEPATMFAGGPVQPDGVIGLGRVGPERTDEAVDSLNPVIPGLGVVDLDQDPDVLAGELDELRLFAGHAGWTPGQLESELEQGGWFVVDARPSDAFSPEPEELWTQVLRRQGGLFITATVDPSSN